ncbi:MAG: chemotaxis protein CheB, partial [Patescibacteria group bacterium]|nr:chemotaxis protein CheB [Patescibacteria group bacterium]
MAAQMIRVLVVDDSVLMREMICDGIEQTPGMEVAGCASDGNKALRALERIQPDVVTLDIQMPNRDGLSTLDEILARHAVPVVMVSAHTRLGADITLDALDRGAIDYVAKPSSSAETRQIFNDELPRKIRSAAGTDVARILEIRLARKQRRQERRQQPAAPKQISEAGTSEFADKCIAIGVSTGGPPALRVLFEGLRPPMPPIVVVQHMPANFTKPLAWRLDALSQLAIKEAEEGDRLKPNHVYFARGGVHLELRRLGNSAQLSLRDGPQVSSHKPSVDVMM